jgi:hypothetical protein
VAESAKCDVRTDREGSVQVDRSSRKTGKGGIMEGRSEDRTGRELRTGSLE